MSLRTALGNVFIDDAVERYILRLVDGTRAPARYGLQFERYLRFGASPRATINLSLAARGLALMAGRDFTLPQDVKEVAHDILRHRLALTYRAEAEAITSDDLIDQLLATIPVLTS
jgi:MoxR-like ATPase